MSTDKLEGLREGQIIEATWPDGSMVRGVLSEVDFDLEMTLPSAHHFYSGHFADAIVKVVGIAEPTNIGAVVGLRGAVRVWIRWTDDSNVANPWMASRDRDLYSWSEINGADLVLLSEGVKE